jgi:predicted site-specific integrase-resolvase
MEYVKRKEALKTLGICYATLYKMAHNKEIDTIIVGNNMVYNVNKYLREKNIINKKRMRYCYCRVSSNKQKEDLERQIAYMKDKFPTHTVISDIESGLNYHRKGLQELLEKAINGEVEEVIIAYKDRLTRFGYELIEWIINKYSNGRIIIINKKEEETPINELTQDIVSIMNIYVAKVNGLRKYKTKIKETIKNGK